MGWVVWHNCLGLDFLHRAFLMRLDDGSHKLIGTSSSSARSGRGHVVSGAHFRDWMRVVGSVMPALALGEFLFINDGTLFAGKLGSFIDQNVCLFGWAHRISAHGTKIFGGSRASPRGSFERTTTSYRLLHAAPGLTR